MSRFKNWNARMRAASLPPSERVQAILAATRGGVSPKLATAVASEPAPAITASPSKSGPDTPKTTTAPVTPTASAAPKPAHVARPLTPELAAIRDQVLAEMAQEAKEKRQAEIRASWDRAYARLRGEPEPDRPDPHGWAKIHADLRAARAASRHAISTTSTKNGSDAGKTTEPNYGWANIHAAIRERRNGVEA